jgi:hypothetical protein
VPDLTTAPPYQRLISAAAAAQQLGVDVDTLLRWHHSRRGPAGYLVGGELAYRTRDIEAWQDLMCEPQSA